MHDKLVTIEIKAKINDNYYEFSVNIANEYINVCDKYNILEELKQIANMLEYNQEFINKMKNVFLAV